MTLPGTQTKAVHHHDYAIATVSDHEQISQIPAKELLGMMVVTNFFLKPNRLGAEAAEGRQ